MKENKVVTLIGHPFAPIGRGEDIRTAFRALKKVMTPVRVLDVFGCSERDEDIEREIKEYLVSDPGKINVFFINGDEIENVLRHLKNPIPPESYNIIYPAWELSIYPAIWAELIERHFDEVWAQSFFVYDALRKAISRPVYHMPLATEVVLNCFLSRRYFGIPESSYVFLFFCDFRSYIERKNPHGILNAFEKVCKERPLEDIRLVIKLSGFEHRQDDYQKFLMNLDSLRFKEKVILINKILSDNEIKNLARCSDCFISLHRSEGYGRGPAEAMCMGKPVVATAYSGNRDFMNKNNSCLVHYTLVPVKEGQYPHASGQVWAEPDIEHAFQHMVKLISDREYGMKVGEVASTQMRQFFGYRAIGLRYRERVKEILNNKPCPKHKIKERKSSQIDGPVIVYNMAKVGSRSVYETLTDLDLGIPIYHRHVLNNLDKMLQEIKKTRTHFTATIKEIEEGIKLRKLIDKNPNKHWYLISLVRDPVARNISRFFQSIDYDEVVPDARKQLGAGLIGVNELIDIFWEKWEHVSALNWFDMQFKPVFNIDVYSRPFPREKGYDIYREGRFSLLLIRLEDLDIHAEQAIEEFLGIPDIKLKRSNVGADKWYKDIYREFLSKITLSDEYIDQIYNSKFVQHFYSHDEINAFRARWIHKNG